MPGIFCGIIKFQRYENDYRYMSKLDELKEEVAWFKALFFALFASDASIIAWMFNSYDSASHLQLIIATFAVFVISMLLIWVNVRAFSKIKQMKDL
ncbi:hypothetical protein [Thiomicrorhabdus indica]|uniref:hypothetical protein n=1 Tax=Thiomicrorhabdus indica TaxID=2267253 RepID=UPI002AA5E767|nr:hypothetical protein [Thiomicrorhabdus indica]